MAGVATARLVQRLGKASWRAGRRRMSAALRKLRPACFGSAAKVSTPDWHSNKAFGTSLTTSTISTGKEMHNVYTPGAGSSAADTADSATSRRRGGMPQEAGAGAPATDKEQADLAPAAGLIQAHRKVRVQQLTLACFDRRTAC